MEMLKLLRNFTSKMLKVWGILGQHFFFCWNFQIENYDLKLSFLLYPYVLKLEHKEFVIKCNFKKIHGSKLEKNNKKLYNSKNDNLEITQGFKPHNAYGH